MSSEVVLRMYRSQAYNMCLSGVSDKRTLVFCTLGTKELLSREVMELA